MRLIVDFDGTLAMGNSSHISLLKPNHALIARLQNIKKSIEVEIGIVTARGGKAGLSKKKKEQRYFKHITDWLTHYSVPYDFISFNKEYGNLYIDDMTVGPYEIFTGITSNFTQNKLIFTDKTVIKSCKSALFEFEWYKQTTLNTPEVLFCNDECIITERIYPDRKPNAGDFIEVINKLAQVKVPQDFQTYLDNLPEYPIKDKLPKHDGTTFHGDLSATNVLASKGKIYLIDPNAKHIFGSFLTDAGKAWFSFYAYEQDIQQAMRISNTFGHDVIKFAVAEGLRVAKYKPEYMDTVNKIYREYC